MLGFLILTIAIAIAGCTTSPLAPSPVHSTPTAMTEAEAWELLEQRPVRPSTLTPGQACPSTHGQVIPYFGFTAGHTPVYPRLGDIPFASAQRFAGGNLENNGWGGQKVLWLIQPPYSGPILIRGRQLNGSNSMRFNGGIDQEGGVTFPLLTGLRLMGSAASDAPGGWPSYTRLRAPGCYIYQVDGLKFSGFLVFQATFD